MSENLKKFLELVSKDENLKQKTLAFNDMEPADAISAGIALAKELGIELSEADFAKEESGGELSDDELDAVAGGGDCACVAGGGGTVYDDDEHFCPCIVYGQGSTICFCAVIGVGDDDWIGN